MTFTRPLTSKLQPWGNKHLGRARQGQRGAGDQGASRKLGTRRLRLERSEAVGWIWSLACFMQPIFLEVWRPKLPHRARRAHVPSQGCENVCASVGVTEARMCVFWGHCIPVSLLFLHSQFQAGGQRVAAFCVFWFWVVLFFFWFQSTRGLGSQGCRLIPGCWHVGPAVLSSCTSSGLTPSQHLWPCCRRDFSVAGGRRGDHTPGSPLCPGQSPCKEGTQT